MISKIIGVILAFVLLILAPLVISQMTQDMSMKRLVLNEVTTCIDKITDKGSVTAEDVNDLYLGINAHGGAFNARFVKYTRIAVPDDTRPDGVKSVYVPTDDEFGEITVELPQGDIIQIRITSLAQTSAQRLLFGLLKITERDYDFTMAGMAR
jgi:hypothetical protein